MQSQLYLSFLGDRASTVDDDDAVSTLQQQQLQQQPYQLWR